MDQQELRQLLPFFIELETSTFCNRTCEYCPNSIFARGKEHRFIDHTLYLKILSDLQTIGYRGILALHNYNEPLLDPNLYDRIQEAKILPGAIAVFTNGDFLTPAVLQKLMDTGLDLLRITLHGRGAPESIFDKAMSLGLVDLVLEPGKSGTRYVTKVDALKVEMFLPDTSRFSTRGGILPPQQPGPSSRCYMPFNSAAIDCEGELKLCCDIYPADPLHRRYGIIGSLRQESFESLWFSPVMNNARREVLDDCVTSPICLQCPAQSNVRGRRCAGQERELLWRKLLLPQEQPTI